MIAAGDETSAARHRPLGHISLLRSSKVGYALDVDFYPTSDFQVVQLTPPGSACSVPIGVGLTDAPPGSARATYLAVADIEAARRELAERGVEVSGIRQKSPVDDWQGDWQPGVDPLHRDYASIAEFAYPDRNTWVIQEVGFPAGPGR